MYVYFPELWYGDDKVAWATGVAWNEGDLVTIDGQIGLLLWEHCIASELIKGQVTGVHVEPVYKTLLTPKALTQIHQFIWERFTTYSNTIPLRLWNDFTIVMKRLLKKQTKTPRHWEMSWLWEWSVSFSAYTGEWKQQVLVFPDLRTMHQQVPARVFDQPWVSRWHAWLTALQKATIFWWIKMGQIHTVVTTPAWIFQDWLLLWDIFLVDAHKRRYKWAQDPRRRTPSVGESLQTIYWANLWRSWYTVPKHLEQN